MRDMTLQPVDAEPLQEQMKMPLVSVVLVVCNVDRFLAEAIGSILDQTFKDFELIIVDYGSTDNSVAIISAFAAKDRRIQLHRIPHCGLAEARNLSCTLARGKYLAIMDADDVSVLERLAWQIEFMEKHPKVGLLGGAVQWIDASGGALVAWNNPSEDREIRCALLTKSAFWQPTVMMRREAFFDVGKYRPPFAPAEDYDLWLRLSEKFEMANLRQVLLRYRIHPHQVSVRRQRQQTMGKLGAQCSASLRKNGLPDLFDEVQEITGEILTAQGVTEAKMQSEIALESARWARHMYAAGEYSTALKVCVELLRNDSKYMERRQIADLYLMAAGLYLKQRQIARSLGAAGRAVVTRPIVAARPLKPWLKQCGVGSGAR